ncbi:MAG TPA: dihydropteroate synthase, partial [Pyrinomonadaceae bacterium]|nr:dihydropteroate synthase [Pyrinomonadaceae bacterium]
TRGVRDDQIALDIGIGFSKTQEQSLELLAKLDNIVDEFKGYPMMVGTSRKLFIAKILGDVPPSERLSGSLGTAVFAVIKGANILRVHDVRETKEALHIVSAIEDRG